MSQLAVRGVSKAYGRRVIFEDASFSVRPGEHVGIVGDNLLNAQGPVPGFAGVDYPLTGRRFLLQIQQSL